MSNDEMNEVLRLYATAAGRGIDLSDVDLETLEY